ncbi:hypothetical protein LINPERHAP1_LOCUS9681 [Linum perenne]
MICRYQKVSRLMCIPSLT